MANRSLLSSIVLVICVAVAALAMLSTTEAGILSDGQLGWARAAAGSRCSGSIYECLEAGEEFEMDSETNRKIIGCGRYISYGALRRNSIPCSHRGASYYNCRPGAASNPYFRGCTAISRCRS